MSNPSNLGRPFTPEEEQYIRDHYLEMTDDEISYKIGHTPRSIANKRSKLGLKKGDGRPLTRNGNVPFCTLNVEARVCKGVNVSCHGCGWASFNQEKREKLPLERIRPGIIGKRV